MTWVPCNANSTISKRKSFRRDENDLLLSSSKIINSIDQFENRNDKKLSIHLFSDDFSAIFADAFSVVLVILEYAAKQQKLVKNIWRFFRLFVTFLP